MKGDAKKMCSRGGDRTKNQDVRADMKIKQIRQWEVAEKLGISEFTLSRWMRKELSGVKKEQINQVMKRIMEEKKRGDADE